MRVNPDPIPDLLAALNQDKLQTQLATTQLATGRSVNQPSDNPTAAALLVENNDQATFNSGYLSSLSAIQGQLSTADSTLSSVTTALQRAVSLGVAAGDGTLSDSDRAAIANEVQEIQSQLVSLANTTYEGHYLFAGTDTTKVPFVADRTALSGVSYVGNTDVNQVAIGSGDQLAINVPGSQLFSASGSDVFLAINSLIEALQPGPNGVNTTGIINATNAISGASSYLSTQRVFYGNAENQAQAQTTYLNAAKLQIAQQETTLGAADLSVAATNLSQSTVDTQAALAAISKLTQNNLFDYIK
jgi:flagellar hook-associated protein 3 FlgL